MVSIEILKVIKYHTENISQEFRLKKTDEIKNYFLEEIGQNELMSRKRKRICTTLNYVQHIFF